MTFMVEDWPAFNDKGVVSPEIVNPVGPLLDRDTVIGELPVERTVTGIVVDDPGANETMEFGGLSDTP
jgi:hypothetical protein